MKLSKRIQDFTVIKNSKNEFKIKLNGFKKDYDKVFTYLCFFKFQVSVVWYK